MTNPALANPTTYALQNAQSALNDVKDYIGSEHNHTLECSFLDTPGYDGALHCTESFLEWTIDCALRDVTTALAATPRTEGRA